MPLQMSEGQYLRTTFEHDPEFVDGALVPRDGPLMMTKSTYMRTSFEPDAEYINGEIRERQVGTLDHADWQQAIQRWFADHGKEWDTRSLSELRIQVSEDRCLVPDVVVLDRRNEREQVPTKPPIAVFEVCSPDQT